MKYKLLAMDFDGTILGHDFTMSPRVRAALERAARKGVVLCANTGRPYAETMPVIRDLPGFQYAVTSNGSQVFHLPSGRLLEEHTFTTEQFERIVDILGKYPIFSQAYVDGYSYAWEPSKAWAKDMPILQRYMKALGDILRSTPDYRQLLRESGRLPGKFFLLSDSGDLQKQVIARLLAVEGVACTSSGPSNVEVLPQGMDKGLGLAAACRDLGISPDEVMAIGDGDNDIPMITAAGLGVAMGNGSQGLKAVAGYVTAPVGEDGFAQAVERFLLEGNC